MPVICTLLLNQARPPVSQSPDESNRIESVFLTVHRQQLGYLTDGSQDRSDICTCYHSDTAQEDQDFCLSRSHCTGIDLASRERMPGAEFEPITSRREVARSIDCPPPPPEPGRLHNLYVLIKTVAV